MAAAAAGLGSGSAPLGPRRALRWLLALLAVAAPSPAGAGLYQAGVDPVWVLEGGSVREALRDAASAWLVQFYSSSCGHCVAFAPTWRALAGDVHEWEPAIRIGVLDCGDEKNYEQCKEYGIQYYPTFRYFKAFTKQFTVGENHHATSDRDLQTIRQTMIDFLQNHSREAKPAACPNLEPTLPEEVFSLFSKHSQHYTAIIFEDGSSYFGREVILDLAQYENLAVKRVLNSETALLKKLGVTSVPSLYLIYPNGSHGLINNLKPLRSFFSSHLKSLPGVRRKLASPLPLLQPKRPGNTDTKEWKESDPSKLYMADLESGLHYLFRIEMATHKTLEGAALRALKDVVIVLAKLFPGRQPVMKSLETLQVWLLSLPLDRIPYDAVLDLLNNKMHISGLFLPSRLQWVGCQGSQVGLRGYTCSFWKIFHSLTVQAAAQPRALLNTGFEDNPRVVLQVMQRYVQDFFGCRACADHFAEMAGASLGLVKSWDEAVLWLWETHNVVNARLAGDLSEDPQFPKVQWPPRALCPACHKATQGPPAWDKTQVLQFLKQHYGSRNLVHTYLEEADNADERKRQGGGEAFPKEAAREANTGHLPQKPLGSESKGPDHGIAKEGSIIDPGKRPAGAMAEQERKQAVSFLGVGFSNIDMSLCIVLYVTSSLFLMIMFFFFRVRSKRWKVRHNRPYV
ncbi:sulfhydryl oxidase 2 [Crotalus tigris]|uniref:sulfhydryl oxidase 2 n=1 Tax=Crotalus tigris TaxID=88082 RepID=UPI00192F8669|nr:sulfhydryl oxidase 2 [Crotalus tigris]